MSWEERVTLKSPNNKLPSLHSQVPRSLVCQSAPNLKSPTLQGGDGDNWRHGGRKLASTGSLPAPHPPARAHAGSRLPLQTRGQAICPRRDSRALTSIPEPSLPGR